MYQSSVTEYFILDSLAPEFILRYPLVVLVGQDTDGNHIAVCPTVGTGYSESSYSGSQAVERLQQDLLDEYLDLVYNIDSGNLINEDQDARYNLFNALLDYRD
jgi:hypothetical protein